MSKTETHVIPAIKGGWSVRKTGAERAEKTFGVKDDAIRYGRAMARVRQTDLIVHKRDGRISERTSYGCDPGPPKSKKK